MSNDRSKCDSKTCRVRDGCKRYEKDKPNSTNFYQNYAIVCNENNDYNFKIDKEIEKNKKSMWGKKIIMDKEKWFNTDSKLFLDVRAIMNKYDLNELIIMGCPDDEYNPEVIDILNKCSYIYSVSEIIIRLKEIFRYWFASEFQDKDLKDMAEELVELFNTKWIKEKYLLNK